MLVRALVVLALALPCLAQPSSLSVQPQPQTAYIEMRGPSQLLNFDFVVRNPGASAWTLTSIEVSVFDPQGQLELRKSINTNGISPSILTVPAREVAPGKEITVFNPFVSFDHEVQLAELRYVFEFEAGDKTQKASAVVRPRRYAGQRLALPLRGRMIVWDGHDALSHHRRWDLTDERVRQIGIRTNSSRYSYDLVKVDAKGDMSSGPAEKNESWFGFGQPIFAAGPGTVVRVHDSNADDRRMNMEVLAKDLWEAFGNYIVVEQANGEFAVYGHIRQGSAKVKTGERVATGQDIAAVGASGSSLFPHLHFQLQDSADFNAEGLPSYFRGFRRVLGSRSVALEDGQIDSGDILEAP